MIKILKKLGLAYLAFGVGVIVGSIIASVVASFLMVASLDKEQLEKIHAIAEDIKKE